MRSTSTVWQEIVSSGNFGIEAMAVIGETEYTEISAPRITRASGSSILSVGACISSCLRLSIRTTDQIAKSAEVEIQGRLASGEQTSEWLSFGKYYISKRESDPVSGVLSLTCYDAMLKTGAYYSGWETVEETVPIQEAVNTIATAIGVSVDARTWNVIIDTAIAVPVTGRTMRAVLEGIGRGFLGNWVITPENKLRLVPLMGSSNTPSPVIGVLTGIETGEELTISGVKMKGGPITYTGGTDTGFVIDCGVVDFATQAFCDAQAALVAGKTYRPFRFTRAIYDPAVEIGDRISNKEDFTAVLWEEEATYAPLFTGDLSAPFGGDMEEEYPYLSTADEIEILEDKIEQMAEEAEEELTARTQALLYMQELAANGLGLYGSYEVSSNGSLVSYWHNRPTREASSTIYQLSSNGFFVSTDGGQTWNAGFDAEGNAVLNVLSVVGLNADWIKTGQLSDLTGGSFWNLNSGEFRTLYMYYEPDSGLHITADNGGELLLTSNGVSVLNNGVSGTTFGYDSLTTTNLYASNGLTIGNFKYAPRSNGNMSLFYVGGN